jgi:hypothetical protein
MARLTVSRKAYKRKAHTSTRKGRKVRVGPSRVRASTYTTNDRGKPGRGPKVVPPLEKGALGGPGFFRKKQDQQEEIVFSRAKKYGERKVIGELRALQVFFKNTDKDKSEQALQLSKKVAGSFVGSQQVDYPEGFRNKHATT